MTREEARQFGLNLLHGIVDRNKVSDPCYADNVKQAIDVLLAPSLPDELEEAAKDRVTENGRFELTAFEKMRIDDIMFGAEWMARQDEVLTTGTVDKLCYDCHDRIPELIEKTGLSADDRVELIVRKI